MRRREFAKWKLVQAVPFLVEQIQPDWEHPMAGLRRMWILERNGLESTDLQKDRSVCCKGNGCGSIGFGKSLVKVCEFGGRAAVG